jgi:hypothetical protein
MIRPQRCRSRRCSERARDLDLFGDLCIREVDDVGIAGARQGELTRLHRKRPTHEVGRSKIPPRDWFGLRSVGR